MKNELKFSLRLYKSVEFVTVKMRNLEKSHLVAQRTQLNVLHLCLIIIILKKKKLVLKNSYLNYLKIIAKYLITLFHFFNIIMKEFRKFKLKTFKFLI